MVNDFHLSRVGYVMMGTADLQRAAAFYRDRLGLRETRQTDDILFLDAGNITLVLSTAIKREPGSTEVVFSADSVQAGYEALKRRGVVFAGEPHQVTGSSWAANFLDPDGHILSLFGSK